MNLPYLCRPYIILNVPFHINNIFCGQELSEYLTQPYRNRDGGGERHDSLDRQQDGSGSGIGRALDRPHLVGKAWYYGTITRAQCDNLLNQHGHDGDFLIRDSETNVSIGNTCQMIMNCWIKYHCM